MTRTAWCRVCAHRIHWVAARSAWVHDVPGADHGPIPTQRKPETVA